jgi:hypothetical protein
LLPGFEASKEIIHEMKLINLLVLIVECWRNVETELILCFVMWGKILSLFSPFKLQVKSWNGFFKIFGKIILKKNSLCFSILNKIVIPQP